jgi:hypothetical protein
MASLRVFRQARYLSIISSASRMDTIEIIMRRLPFWKGSEKDEKGIVDCAGDCVGGSGVYLTNNVWSSPEMT